MKFLKDLLFKKSNSPTQAERLAQYAENDIKEACKKGGNPFALAKKLSQYEATMAQNRNLLPDTDKGNICYIAQNATHLIIRNKALELLQSLDIQTK